jgi:hypothetical protein
MDHAARAPRDRLPGETLISGRTLRTILPLVLLLASLPGYVGATIEPASTSTFSGSAKAPSGGFSDERFVYCFGDPNWAYGNSAERGWWYGGTSTGWVREAADDSVNAERVQYDDSVKVMQSVAASTGQPRTQGRCHTIKAQIDPRDPVVPGIANPSQRALVRLTNPNTTNPFYGPRPSIIPRNGETWWYGFAFATNAGFVPHRGTFGNWNGIFAWHNNFGYLQNIMLEVDTLGPTKSGGGAFSCVKPLTTLSRPRLGIQLQGGNANDSSWPYGSSQLTCLRFQGPIFQPGRLYRVSMRVSWSPYMRGTLEVWFDGLKYVDVRGISNMWYSGSTIDSGIYPIFTNYRPYDTSLPINVVYYGGLIRGTTRADVGIPCTPPLVTRCGSRPSHPPSTRPTGTKRHRP